jgi:hypothetical protein
MGRRAMGRPASDLDDYLEWQQRLASEGNLDPMRRSRLEARLLIAITRLRCENYSR